MTVAEPVSRRPSASVEVRSRMTRKLSWIPDSVYEHFHEQNKLVALNFGAPDAVAQLSGIYRYPIYTTDLNEELVADLKEAGFTVSPTDETLRRGDCILFWVDAETHEALRDEAEIAFRQQHLRPHEEAVGELDEDFRRRSGGFLGVREDPRTAHHVDDHINAIHRGRR